MPDILARQDVIFSSLHFGTKGDNAAQIIKNLSWIIGRESPLSTLETHNKLEDIYKTSIVGIGDGIAVFDWTSEKISEPYLLCSVLESPVFFPSVDERAADIAVILVSPAKHGPLHLQYLSRMTRILRDTKLLESIRNVTCRDGLISVLSPENRKLLAA